MDLEKAQSDLGLPGQEILLALQGPYAMEQANRRRSPRQSIVTPVTVCRIEERDAPLVRALSISVSDGGMSFLSSAFLLPATPLWVQFDILENSPPIRALSLTCVKVGEDWFRVGVQFVGSSKTREEAEA